MDKIEFKATINGSEQELAVIKPNRKAMNEAQVVYHKSFKEALDNGMMVRAKIDDYLKRQNLWDDAKEMEYSELQQTINNGRKRLDAGGIKLAEAKKIALEMKKARDGIRQLIAVKVEMDNNCAEGVAQAAQFDCLVSNSVVYNLTNERVFKGYQDYLDKAYEPWVNQAASLLSKLMYGLEDDYEKKLPENQFLVKHGFANEKLKLVNKDGHLVDIDGRLINEEDRYVNEKGEYVDKNGDRIDKDGNYVVEFKPFLDDDDQPIIETAETVEPVVEATPATEVKTEEAIV